MLPPDDEQIGFQMASACATRASIADLKLYDCEEALQVDPAAGKWIQLAKTAAMGPRTTIQEDSPELPKTGDSHAEEGREALEGLYSYGCTSLEESRISGRSGRAGGQVSAAQTRPCPAGTVSKGHRIVPA
jgi:hypothetical protein